MKFKLDHFWDFDEMDEISPDHFSDFDEMDEISADHFWGDEI